MSVSLNNLTVDQLELGRLVSDALLIFSGVVVWAGVFLERDRFSEAIKKYGWIVLMIGLSGETLFSAALWEVDSLISFKQREEITALETRLAARTLSDSQVAAIKIQIGVFPGQVFTIIPYWDDNESMGIANRIAETLVGSGWKLENPEHGEQLVGVVAGTAVNVDKNASERTRAAAKELTAALMRAGVDVTEHENDNPYPTDKIMMSVGIKP